MEFVQSATVYMFGDDTTMFCIGKSIDEVSAALNQALSELYAWYAKNKLIPHLKKSECMIIYRGNFIGPFPLISLSGNSLNWGKHSRLQGVVIDDKLSLYAHVADMKKSFLNKLSLIYKCRFLPKQVLLDLYFKVIIPAVTYDIAV